jgi:LytS/YehU family sensor histidine kinase
MMRLSMKIGRMIDISCVIAAIAMGIICGPTLIDTLGWKSGLYFMITPVWYSLMTALSSSYEYET